MITNQQNNHRRALSTLDFRQPNEVFAVLTLA